MKESAARTGTLEITHDGDESVSADALKMTVLPDKLDIDDSVWADEYDPVSEGDSVVLDLGDTDPDYVYIMYGKQGIVAQTKL